MSRHQRRGNVGHTNLPSPHKHGHHHHGSANAVPAVDSGSKSPTSHSPSRKRQLRAKWKLDVAPVPRDLEALHRQQPLPRHESDTPESRLAANIEAVQHDRKSFKDEPWYYSPVGAGSKSSVVLSALTQQDHNATGYLPRASILATLQHGQFGLSEGDIGKLLRRYDPAQDQIHYKTFVGHLHFSEPLPVPDEHDMVFRHQSYLEKIRDHAARLVDDGAGSLSVSPVKLSPLASTTKRDTGTVTIHEPGVVLGSSPVHSPSHRLAPLTEASAAHDHELLSPSRYEYPAHDDRLSFVHDKQRREQRANAKAATLLAHISRIEAYARRQDAVATQVENLRLAHKALHHGEHLARVFDEQHRQLHRLENQGKAQVDTESKRAAQRE